ncbi:hypothetical protein D9M71_256820 [compost metagenome]
MAVVQRGDRLEAEVGTVLEDFVDGGSRTLDLTRGLRGHVHRRFLDGGELQVEALFLEVAEVAGEVQGAVADPGGMADGQGAGLRAAGSGGGEGGEREGTNRTRKQGLDHEDSHSRWACYWITAAVARRPEDFISRGRAGGAGLCGPWPGGAARGT